MQLSSIDDVGVAILGNENRSKYIALHFSYKLANKETNLEIQKSYMNNEYI